MTTLATVHDPVSDLQQHTALIQRFIAEVWNAHDPAAADVFLTADYVDHAYQPPTGEGLKHIIALTGAAFPDYEFLIDDIVAQDNTVVVRMTMRATHAGPFRGTPASGKQVVVGVYRTFRISGGKIAEHWGLFDTTTLLAQIGATPQPR